MEKENNRVINIEHEYLIKTYIKYGPQELIRGNKSKIKKSKYGNIFGN